MNDGRSLVRRATDVVNAYIVVELAEMMARETEDLAVVTQYDIEFHATIARAGRNALFAQIVTSFAPMMQVAVPAARQTRTATEHRAVMIDRRRDRRGR